MKKTGFSLAEALITLLIVSIIAIASVPVITKKKNNTNRELWKIERNTQTAIYPSNGRDIRLGDINKKESQGIVVYGTLYFMDRNGNTIGWIKENGETSFGSNANQQKTMEMLSELSRQLVNTLSAANELQNLNYHDKRSKKKAQEIIDTQVSQEKMDEIIQLQAQLKELIEQNNMNIQREGR